MPFTDTHLSILFLQLKKDYDELRLNPNTSNDVPLHIKNKFESYINAENSLFSWKKIADFNTSTRSYNAANLEKMYAVLNYFIESYPITPAEGTRSARIDMPFNMNTYFTDRPTQAYSGPLLSDRLLIDWLLWRELFRPPQIHHHYYPNSNDNSRASTKEMSRDDSKTDKLKLLVLVVVGASAIVATFISLYYLLDQTLTAFERLWYNEGRLQACLGAVSALAFGFATNFLAATLGYSSILNFFLWTTVANPLFWTGVSVLTLSIIGAAAGWYLFETLQTYFLKTPGTLILADPYHYALTPKEIENLKDKNLDVLKIKCALVACYEELGAKPIPSYLTRFFKSSEKEKEILKLIRKLRAGEIGTPESELSIGKGRFEFSIQNEEQPGMDMEVEGMPNVSAPSPVPSAPFPSLQGE